MSSVPWLEEGDLRFPSTELALADPNGLLAVGGDLDPERLLAAYRNGIFPWYESPQPILWWSPSPRAILFPEKIRISKSLRKTLKQGDFKITGDTAFRDVMRQCALTPRKGQGGTWIGREMLDAYCELHRMGFAHSVETWCDGKLVGGLYGVAIGKVFFGESMFSTQTDASKVALVYLARQLKQWSYALIDCQVSNPHLLSLGVEVIDRKTFTRLLGDNINTISNQSWPREWSHLSDNWECKL